jgi:hypothetical protein
MNRDQHANKLSVLAVGLIRDSAHEASRFVGAHHFVAFPDTPIRVIPGNFIFEDDYCAPQIAQAVIPRTYSGHGENTGGLQEHSIGGTYPYVVVGTQSSLDGPLGWYVRDSRNDRRSQTVYDQNVALEIVKILKQQPGYAAALLSDIVP